MIRELEQLGYDVDILHERWKSSYNTVMPRGGRTVAIITSRDRKEIYAGVALCNMTDNYSKKVGRQLAVKRAIMQSELLKSKLADLLWNSNKI